MENQPTIITEEAYQQAMIAIFELMERGDEDLSPEEREHLKELTSATEKYENEYL